MDTCLLSIVVPTKNRVEYLKSFLLSTNLLDHTKFEVIVQDNSTDNVDILKFLKDNDFPQVRYAYSSASLSVCENSDSGVSRARGQYVCFIGDDDFVSSLLIDMAESMQRCSIDSCCFGQAIYNWPGLVFAAHHFSSLNVSKFKGRTTPVNVKTELRKVLATGAVGLKKLPRLYHGVVKKEILEQLYSETGTYFPGPSPDMANAVGLCRFVKTHWYHDAPLIVSGKSPKSTSGLGARHQHVGKLADIEFLPSDVLKKWNKKIPKIWTGETIYAQSAYMALKSCGLDDEYQLNFSALYAKFIVFHPEMTSMVTDITKSEKSILAETLLRSVYVFTKRAIRYIKNGSKARVVKAKCDGLEDINDTVEAMRVVDELFYRKNLHTAIRRLDHICR